jgi:sugar-specific transcriptional regulator TrmB
MFTIEEDFHGWLLDQAAALRARDYEALDCDHLAEELEIMGARERREMKDRLITLQEHLLKLKFEPAEVHRHNSWRNTIEETRERIGDILEDSPGIFQGKPDQMLAETYKRARKAAARSSGLPVSTFPEECLWTYEQVMDENFFPGVTKTSIG